MVKGAEVEDEDEEEEDVKETLSPEKIDQIRRMLQCPICLQQFTDPRGLPCMHAFCTACLEQHMAETGKDGKFSCPMCKDEFAIPKEGVSGFKKSYHLLGLGELFPKEGSISCDFCKSDGQDVQATSLCTQCNDHLCESCAKSHRRHTKTHRVVSLEEVKSGKHFQHIRCHQKINCSVHKSKLLELYCEQCEIPICLDCNTSSHNDHKVKNTKEAAKNAKAVMRELLEPWKDVPEHYEMMCEKQKQILESLEHQQKDCESKIKELYSALQAVTVTPPQEIEKHEKNAMDELNKKVTAMKKQAEDGYKEFKLNKEKFAHLLEYVNSVLESAQDVEKLQQFKEIRLRLENFNISQIVTHLKKRVIKLQPERIAVPGLTVNIVAELEDESILSKFSEKFASVVAVYSKSPVHREGPQSAVKHVQLERRFSSMLEGEEVGCCVGLAVGDGVVVVTDSKNKNVKVFDKNNFTFKLTLNQTQHRLRSPCDVTCNTLGEIFITDLGIHGVVKCDATGQLVKAYPGLYRNMGRITCHVDQLIVADTQGGRVMYTDFECKVTHQIDADSLGLNEFSPHYICVDENSRHLVVSQWKPPCVYVIDPTQPAVIHAFSDELRRPRGVCVDQFGHILLADSKDSNHRIILLTPASADVITTEDDVSSPTAICTSGPGQVYVLEQGGNVKEFKYIDN